MKKQESIFTKHSEHSTEKQISDQPPVSRASKSRGFSIHQKLVGVTAALFFLECQVATTPVTTARNSAFLKNRQASVAFEVRETCKKLT